MNIALSSNNERVTALPKSIAVCPICSEKVISKCGKIKVWHWSHKKGEDCDSFGEPETPWHLNWKNMFPQENQEVILTEREIILREMRKHSIEDPDTKHRADVFINGKVIEFQNSPISSGEITEREEFYERMIWLINGETFAKGLEFRKHNDKIITFRWKNPPKSWWCAKKPLYIDISFWLNNSLFLIKKLYQNIPCGGYGILLSKEQFIEEAKREWKRE